MIREFINNNNITFEKGNRNPTMITLIGYSLYLNLNKENLENELSEEINNRNRQESAMSTVDSVDIDAGIYFRLNWRPCSN